jgi:MFS family permease
VHSETELVINRFLLGLSEGGTLPGFVVLMRSWFTRDERARANMVLMGTPIAIALGNPLCGFAVGAIPALLWCLVWWWAIDDNPRQTNWMQPTEKAALIATLDAETREDVVSQLHWFRVIWNPVVLLLSAYDLLGLTRCGGCRTGCPRCWWRRGTPLGCQGCSVRSRM